jgi:hypothetical protein
MNDQFDSVPTSRNNHKAYYIYERLARMYGSPQPCFDDNYFSILSLVHQKVMYTTDSMIPQSFRYSTMINIVVTIRTEQMMYPPSEKLPLISISLLQTEQLPNVVMFHIPAC